MAGKKRRKASSATGKASAKRKSETSAAAEVPIHICSTILRHVLDIASSRSRAVDVLQTFNDGKCWTDTKKVPTNATVTLSTSPVASSSPTEATRSRGLGNKKNQIRANFDCYWVILATNTMNRLLVFQYEDSKRKTAIVKYITALADALATILLSDKSKLEKCAQLSASRSILCRAILTTTLAAMYGMRNYDPQQEPQGKHDTYEAAVATLDRLVHLRAGQAAYGNKTDANDKKQKENHNISSLSTVGKWTESALESECSIIEELIRKSSGNSGHDCVKILLETTKMVTKPTGEEETEGSVIAKSTPAKRSTRTRSGAKSYSAVTERKALTKRAPASTEKKEDEPTSRSIDPLPIVAAFEKLLALENFGIRIDHRVAIKRWASIAVVWSQRGEGQNLILREIHELCTDKEYERTITPFEKSRLMGVLISIVIETGTQCGVRPPTGGIEQYLVSITSSAGTTISKSSDESRAKRSKKTVGGDGDSPTTIGGSKKFKSMRRADIRDWATVVIYDYLQNHKKCLLGSIESTREHECGNDNKLGNITNESNAFSVPNFSDLITGFCRIASSSVQNSSYSEQNAWKRALLSIAAAFCFEMAAEPAVPLDSKTITFALSQFVDSMRTMDPHPIMGTTSNSRVTVTDTSSIVSEKQIRDFESKHSLRVRLPSPCVPTESFVSNDSNFSSTHTCNFAGLVSNADSFFDEHAIALAIRAVQTTARRGRSSPPLRNFLSFVIDLVKRAYDTSAPNASDSSQQNEEKTEKPASTGKRKRTSTKGSSANRRDSRRRKKASGEAQQVYDQDKLAWNRISPEKASVAIAALNAIRMWLMNKKCAIRRIFCNTVTIHHMLELVKLGDTLDKIMIKSRCATTCVANETGSMTSNSSPLSSSSSDDDFTSSEILLWNAHMIACQVFGRGRLTYAEDSGIDPIIWNKDNRMAIYKAIAALVGSPRSEGTGKILLSLPAAHHALLAANMSSASKEENKDPEKHIVDCYINSIIYVFGNLETLTPKDWGPNGRIVDDDIPLSYNDARTFMLALDGLSLEDKCRYFDLLVNSALDAFKPIMKSKQKRESLLCNSEVSGFLARVLVVCYSLMNRIVSGKELGQIFFGNMGCAQMHMPSFVTRADWYRRDRTFMGIFDAWESSSLPEGVTHKKDSQTLVPKKSLNDFRSLLEISFSIGFDAAPHDHCHLLFTAWNGLDQVSEKSGLSNSGDKFPTMTASMEDYPRKILQLREDVFSIYKASNDSMPIDLKGMISRASEITDLILKSYIPDDEKMEQEIPLPVMVLLASLPTYIAAGISGLTKPGNDYFSTTMSKSWTRNNKRHRGYSSESDPPPSECESDGDVDDYENEAIIDAISRLKECCDAFGAAPIHPDWLDVSCSLREGIRPSDAVEMAEKAISTLSRLITIAFTEYKRRQSCAIQMLLEDQDGIEQSVKLCTTILRWSRHETGPSQYPNDREWLDDVATVAKIPQEVIEYMLEDVHLEQTKACWCPYAGQKLRGLLQEENRLIQGSGLIGGWETSNAELRAGGEWELLLAEALCVSCLNTSQKDNDNQKQLSEVDPPIGSDSSSEMAKAQLWRAVFMSATSHLVPAAALLRLSLGKVGRKPHPFAFHENNQDPYDAAPLHFSEPLNGVESHASSASLRGTVCETLSLLARLSIEAEDSLSITCHAVASHLVVDTNTFSDLKALSSIKCAFIGLKLVREIAESSPKKEVRSVIPFIVERLVSLMENSGREGIGVSTSSTSADLTKFGRMHYFLGDASICLVDTIANKSSIDMIKILKSRQLKEICEDEVETYKWSHDASKEKAVGELVSILCEDSLRANGQTRSHVALILSRVGIIESESIMNSTTTKRSLAINSLIKSFNRVDKKDLRSLIVRDFCSVRGSKIQSETFRRDIAAIFCLLLFSRSSPKFDKAKFVHDTLMTAFESWKKINRPHRELTLNVLMAYGTFFSSIFEIGSKLVDLTGKAESSDEPSGEAELLSIYFTSIKNLQGVLMDKHKVSSESSKKNRTSLRSPSSDSAALPSEFPRSCSFIQKSGFHGQHWYHCYTCNLVADKGCCTLCALVCHRDHDVAYSRHSSFFCDCAAEDGNSVEQNRVSCKCLSTLPASELDSIHENERMWKNRRIKTLKDHHDVENTDFIFEKSLFIEIAKYCFADKALISVNQFLFDIKKSRWLDSLFNVLNNEFNHWKSQYGDAIHFLLQKCSQASPDVTPILRLSHELVQRKLRKRGSKILKLKRMDEDGLVSVRVGTGFESKLPSDSSTHDALTLARLSRNDISRSILVFDSRGRMLIAEPCSLVFCSPMAAVNTRNLKNSEEEHFTRQQMCILGTASLSFNVVGMRLCTENERHVVVWGTSEACVLVLKADFRGIEDTINLSFEVDDQDRDGDVLVNCEWLPGSQTHVAVGVSRFVRLFDVCRSDSTGDTKRAHPVIGYNLGFDAHLRDLSIVPQKEYTSTEGDAGQSLKNYQAEHISKMFLLLENGRLHSLDIKISNGKIESPSELHFEPSECVSISTEGIRPRSTSSVGLPGTSTRTLGEGSKLAYLKQSRCLLYKCKSAAVVALMLGTDGNVTGTFELLPHTIPLSVMGSEDEDDVYSISGPYTLWTELGMVYRNGETYFRVACAGRLTRNNQTKLLCIDFNENETKIKEITCSLGLGFNLGSFEGLGTFTSPIIQDDASSHDRYMTGERTFLCVLTSGGNLHIFGEDLVDMMPTSIGPNGDVVPSNPVELVPIAKILSTPIMKFPLTIFEQLTNISENENLLFSGQGLGIDSKELKNRLARDSSSSFVCPRREGCCVAISLPQSMEAAPNSKSSSSSKPSHFVISAIRVLVGSSSDCMPSKIFVQGRSIDITPKLKRWYNVPLTEEEISRGMRTGLVSLWIGPSFDPTNAPVIDSVEVFASERKSLEMALPKSYFASMSTPNLKDSMKTAMEATNAAAFGNKEVTSDGLILGVRATTDMCELMGSSVSVSDTGKDILRQLIQVTTVHPEKKLGESLQILSNSLDQDARSRWSFQDENTLIGCSRSLDECNALLNESTTNNSNDDINASEDLKWKAVRMVLRDCLKVSTLIARERPNNYLQSMGNMLENNLKSGSIAIEASKLILKGLKNSSGFEDLIGGSRGIVTLSLTEMAIVIYMDDSTSTKDFMQISQIREFLDVANVSTCEAISTFFQDNENEKNKSSIPDLFVQMEAARRVAYQCDSCGICPMKKVRYTILEEDYGMDLCKKCYEVGKAFAAKKKYKSSVEVVINGKSMGGNLTCAHMKKMEPVSLEKMEMDVEQVEVQYAQPQISMQTHGSGNGDENPEKASKMSLGENFNDSSQQDLSGDHRGYEYFLGELYSFVMEQLAFAFKKERCNSSTESLIKLVLDLIRHSKRDTLKHERAVGFVKDISKGISQILNLSSQKQKLTQYKMSTLVTCLRGLSSLTVSDSKSEFHFPGSKSDGFYRSQARSNENKKYKFLCDVHRIPAVRRRCDKAGVNKDRRFYVCGKEKGQRCTYFKWADDGPTKKETKPAKSQFYKIVQSAMLDHLSSSHESMYDRLCILLEGELFGEEGGAYDVSILASNTKEKKSEDSLLKSFYSVQNMEKDFNDGVFCSKEKLLDVASGEMLVKTELAGTHELSMPVRAAGDRGALLLEASLDLLTLIADHKTNGISRWFSILCEITMATNKHSSLRSLATKVLKSLCGGNRKKYHYVRDHFTFCFQLKRLYHFSYNILESALIVKEKTRQCSPDWKSPAIQWSTIGVGDLIGTQDLISEDDLTELNLKGCGKALDDMWSIIKNRGGSWRQFCGFQSLPLSQRQGANSNLNKNQQIMEKKLADAPPIEVLFWIASSLSGINQVKVLSMIDFALIDWKGRKSLKTAATSADEGSSNEKDPEDDLVIGIGSAMSKPEEILLKPGSGKMTVDDIIAFSLHLVHNGKTSELRRVGYQIVSKLSHVISSEERLYLFKNLVASIERVGILGKAGIEFFNLLQSLSQYLPPNETVGQISDFVVDSFMQQLDAIKYDRSNCEWAVLETNVGSTVAKKKFDLSGCLFCIKPQHYSGARESSNKSSERRNLSNSGRVAARSGSAVPSGSRSSIAPREKWRYEQVSQFTRCRLDSLKESCISNEFNLFYKLKHRLLISDIHLTVSDPRGRYVKTISIFFTPRPLSDSLKSNHYASKWQKIATLNLTRGGSRASVSLPQPIIAANIRVEFTEFYERPGDKDKGAAGSLVLHCPRCLRPVTNAHGVCVTCGEVAFQCRKCRHINYDRLDAFLCVECGYTCCGSFSLELNSSVVSNAIAITNDADFDKSIEMYGTVSSIQEGLKEKLGEKLRSLKQKKQSNEVESDSFYDTVMERAFLGLLPPGENEDTKDSQELRVLDRLNKPGAVIKYAAHPDNNPGESSRSNSAPDRSERARSLLRLARQIRSESSSSSDRRRSTDIIIRHLGRVSLQNLEDENELLEILESGNSVRNQGQNNDKSSGDKDPKNKEKSQKVEVEECQKMLHLLREAWRESYELGRRIDAWKSLNSGALVKSTPLDRTTDRSFSFSPSHCSNCGGSIALHLLVLWLKLFLVAPAHARVNKEFFVILFQDDASSHSKGLQEIKKQVIISIATNSREGAEMVLRELEKRLKASRDMYCAEILGKIMEIEGFGMINEYAKLAMDILSSQSNIANSIM